MAREVTLFSSARSTKPAHIRWRGVREDDSAGRTSLRDRGGSGRPSSTMTVVATLQNAPHFLLLMSRSSKAATPLSR